MHVLRAAPGTVPWQLVELELRAGDTVVLLAGADETEFPGTVAEDAIRIALDEPTAPAAARAIGEYLATPAAWRMPPVDPATARRARWMAISRASVAVIRVCASRTEG
jgi:hypothetical protein